ncbi:MAG: hypothetical protein KC620_24960, partial [Myxococcales bacterium]|nr:hypothetical protein [Myxococcales bacterium]
PARAKPEGEAFSPGETDVAGARVNVTSREAFEFFAGVVDVRPGDTELVVTWDVRDWLREVLSEPLGLRAVETSEPAPLDGFADLADAFNLITY